MKIGLYGGTFDPVHLGHLILAETVREQLDLDEIWFIPAYQNPLKAIRPITPPKSRLEMLRFAIAGNPHFRLKDLEVKRKGASYTFETLEKLQQANQEQQFYLLIGADCLSEFPNWRQPGRILELAQLVAVNRGLEIPQVPLEIDATRVHVLQMPAIEIASTEIRARCAAGKSIRYLTPRAVELFIQANKLYLDTQSHEVSTG